MYMARQSIAITIFFFSWTEFMLMSSGAAFEDNGTWTLAILLSEQQVVEFQVDINVQIVHGPGILDLLFYIS